MRNATIATSLALATLALPSLVFAQSDALQRAEQAYAQVDFESTLRLATEALTGGQHSRDQTVRIYQLLGIAAAALEQDDRSRDAYLRMLALNPDAQLDQGVAPQFRGPFLEARGFWTSRSDRFDARAVLARQRGALRIDVSDPLNMARTVVVRSRIEGSPTFVESRHPAAARIYAPVRGAREADRVEFNLVVLDEHNNRLLELGSDDDPRVVGRPRVPIGPGREESSSVFASPWFWVATAVLIGGGVVTGIVLADQAGTVGGESEVRIGLE
ncbi:MAG: hypothetical protein IT379_10235 [Deltaproteobacteria bacterium]|nr:hypothetical protein [Deltaproteobacteria bacterium]